VSLPTWHSRGYLPHWEAGAVPQSITFRLADSLPSALLDRWSEELQSLAGDERANERRRRIQIALDQGHGSAALAKPMIAEMVEHALLHFDNERYRLHAWCIMPTHVHVVATPLSQQTLSQIAHAWKSFTSKKANALLKRTGAFWTPEYFDRAIRDETHYANAVGYVAMNPVKAGLCGRPGDWRFSSAWEGRLIGASQTITK
jgi:putative DNA methylase